MKKKLISLLMLIVFLLATPLQSLAQSPQRHTFSGVLSSPRLDENKATFTLEEIGYRQRELVSPLDATRVRFNIPAGLRFLPGGVLELQYDLVLSGADASNILNGQNPYGGSLVISYNEVIVGNVPLDSIGTHSVRVPIPPAALISKETDGSQLLSISLNAQFSCLYDLRAFVTIKPTSFFDFPYETSPLALDLAKFPAPFYTQNSFLPEQTLLVIPDSLDAAELQAAMDVMAGLGGIIGGTYGIQMVNVAQLARLDLSLYHLIFVGTPAHFGSLAEIAFPLPVSEGQFTGLPDDASEDGVIQLALSPWNPNKAILHVGGNSGSAVLKAAQALGSGNVLAFDNPALTYVSNVQTLVDSISTIPEFTLQNLGYTTKTLTGVGVTSTQYSFFLSQEQVSTKEGYLDLVYYHSGLLDFGSASVSLEMNNQVFASVAFGKESQQVSTLQIKLPPGVLKYGENVLAVVAVMPQYTQSVNPACDHTGMSNPWLTISDQTKIHIPPATEPVSDKTLRNDMRLFIDHLSDDKNLAGVALILPSNNQAAWDIAAQFAYTLGDSANPVIPDLTVAFADDVSQEIKNTKTLILLGLPNELPLLIEFNDLLPAPFDFSTNLANQRNMQISFRIPSNADVGYLQLLTSPYNPEKAIFVISGSSSKGLEQAGSALLVSSLLSQLGGVFAVTNGVQIAIGSNASPVQIDTAIEGAVPVTATPLPDAVSQTPEEVRPTWPVPVIVVTSLIILAILGVGFRTFARRKHSDTQNTVDAEKPESTGDDGP
jgi:hypothetical protein